jgi:hypothetical protein
VSEPAVGNAVFPAAGIYRSGGAQVSLISIHPYKSGLFQNACNQFRAGALRNVTRTLRAVFSLAVVLQSMSRMEMVILSPSETYQNWSW